MLRIGICDDQAEARLLLRSALERILDEQNVREAALFPRDVTRLEP